MSSKKFRILGLFKTPLFWAMVVLLLFSFCFVVFQKGQTPEGSLNKFNKIDDFYLFGQELFKIETLSLNLFQENTLISSPSLFQTSPKVYGAASGIEERDEPMEYIVQKGDTFSGIANKFNISLNTILWANNLTTKSKIETNDRLLILPVSGIIYFVQPNETVSQIAKKCKTTSEKIIEFNELSYDGKIFEGDALIVPDGIMPPKTVYSVKVVNLPDSFFMFPTTGIITKTIWGHGYEAVDIANDCGTTPIVAAASGKVIRAGYREWRCGNGIDIEHSRGVITRYCHLSKISVSAGENVEKGQPIGMMGNTGHTVGPTGCHLHFHTIGATNPLRNYKLGTTISWK